VVIPFQIEAGPTIGQSLLRVRCSPEQAVVLKRLLAGAFPGQAVTLVRELDQTRFSHRCLVPESEAALRDHWVGWQVQLILAASLGPRAGAGGATAVPDPTNSPEAGSPEPPRHNRQAAGAAPPASLPDSISAGSLDADAYPVDASPPDLPAPSATSGSGAPHSGPPWRPVWAARPEPPASDLLERRLISLAAMTPSARLAALEEMTASSGRPLPEPFRLLPAQTLYEMGEYERAAARFIWPAPDLPPEQRARYLARYAESLVLGGRHAEVPTVVTADEPDPAARGMLGAALARADRPIEALPHLQYAWAGSARRPVIALALARLLWEQGSEEAADPYTFLFKGDAEDLEASDYLVMAELAEMDAFGPEAGDWHLTFIERFFDRADPAMRSTEDAKQLARRGLELAHQLGNADRLFHAYQQVLDDLMARPAGEVGDLTRTIERIAADHHGGRLDGAQRFDLLEECLPSIKDYPLVLRQVLIGGFEDLLGWELTALGTKGAAFPPYVKDLGRALHRLKSKDVVVDAYKRAVAARSATEQPADLDETPRGLVGKRIALVGGHDRTRQLVRERLHGWGAHVDEMPPPTTGRVNERDMLDRVRSSDLIVLIVSYMGHDMSTIISNLKHRDALRGTVLPVDCRGVSGVCRAILDWSEG
jgi:hypothetical protein